MWQVRGTGKMPTGFWYGNLQKRCYLKKSMSKRIILKWISKISVEREWTEFIRLGKSGGLL
jgi:hypothetical protein